VALGGARSGSLTYFKTRLRCWTSTEQNVLKTESQTRLRHRPPVRMDTVIGQVESKNYLVKRLFAIEIHIPQEKFLYHVHRPI
jgi:hypothetical protein